MTTVHIDCDGCVMRGIGCSDCVVTVMLGTAPEGVVLDDIDRAALAALAAGGLVPRLRHVRTDPPGLPAASVGRYA